MLDIPRQSATRYSLTLEEVAHQFEEAGLPRNTRSLQRYCAAGRLDCIKEETVSGLAYFVDPVSVQRAITQLAQLHAITDDVRHSSTTGKPSHNFAPPLEPILDAEPARQSAVNRGNDAPEIKERQAAPEPDTSRFVALLENANESLREQNSFFRDQLVVKDTQIAALLERDKETNYLVRGLQTMLAPLLGQGRHAAGPVSPEKGSESHGAVKDDHQMAT